MINISFSKGIFLDYLNVPDVIPMNKKGEKLGSYNYRPISLLSNVGELWEKSMHIQLANFLRKLLLAKCCFSTNLAF